MEAAIHLFSKIPGDTLRIICLFVVTMVFFLPLFFIKKRNSHSVHEMLRDTKMVLEIRKLTLELDEKLNPYPGYGSTEIEKKRDGEVRDYAQDVYREQSSDELPYYKKIKYSTLGSGFFFMITTIALLSSEHEMVDTNDYVAAFTRDLAVCIASGFAATFIPWGSNWYYFIYGFTIPILIATIIVIIT